MKKFRFSFRWTSFSEHHDHHEHHEHHDHDHHEHHGHDGHDDHDGHDGHDDHDGHERHDGNDGHDNEVWLRQASLPKNMLYHKRVLKNVYVKGGKTHIRSFGLALDLKLINFQNYSRISSC